VALLGGLPLRQWRQPEQQQMGAPMSKRKGHVAALIAATVISSAVSVAARADQYSDRIFGEDHVSGGAIMMDAVIARPVLLVGTVVGAGLFIVSAPFSLAGGNVGTAWDTLVGAPAEQTFSRCLGCTPVQHSRAKADRDTQLANQPKE
jgi:hypothetical protein